MDEFPSNSHNVLGSKKAKEEKPEKMEKITTGVVIQKPKSLGRKFKELFVGGEGRGAARYVVGDVLLPAFKNMVVDATSKGVERLIYGDSGPRRRMDYGRPRISYHQPIDRGYPRGRGAILPDQPPRGPSRRPDAGEIILVSRDEAELVLERMIDVIDKFDFVSVADLHELVGLPATYVDNKWGWQSLQYSDIRQIREGFLLNLPSPEPI